MTVRPARLLPTPPAARRLVGGLVDALQSERRLVEELAALMLRQRSSVAADDLPGIDDTVFGIQRVLVTLAEAKRRRRAINLHMGLPEDLALNELLTILGAEATDDLWVARDELQQAATALAREVAVNKQVLREAIASTTDHVVQLVQAGGERPDAYPDAATGRTDRGPQLVNRRV